MKGKYIVFLRITSEHNINTYTDDGRLIGILCYWTTVFRLKNSALFQFFTELKAKNNQTIKRPLAEISREISFVIATRCLLVTNFLIKVKMYAPCQTKYKEKRVNVVQRDEGLFERMERLQLCVKTAGTSVCEKVQEKVISTVSGYLIAIINGVTFCVRVAICLS